MATEQAVAAMLALFHELYPSRDLTDATPAAWMFAIGDVSDERLRWAAKRLAHEPGRVYFPTPNELLQHIPPEGYRPALPNPDDGISKYYADIAKNSKRIKGPSE